MVGVLVGEQSLCFGSWSLLSPLDENLDLMTVWQESFAAMVCENDKQRPLKSHGRPEYHLGMTSSRFHCTRRSPETQGE
jgi:hypothetical protein